MAHYTFHANVETVGLPELGVGWDLPTVWFWMGTRIAYLKQKCVGASVSQMLIEQILCARAFLGGWRHSGRQDKSPCLMRLASDRWNWTLEMTGGFTSGYLENLKAKSVSEEREMKAFAVIPNWCVWGFSPSGPAHLPSFRSTPPPLPHLTSPLFHWPTCISQASPSFPHNASV